MVNRQNDLRQRLERLTSYSLQNWREDLEREREQLRENVSVDMGWGRVIFGHTFRSTEKLYHTVCQEEPGKRDITVYLRDPHVLLAQGPGKLFLDPSHTYRLWMHDYQTGKKRWPSFNVRRISALDDATAVNRIYASRQMVTCDPEFMLDRHTSRMRTYLVAEHLPDKRIIGAVTGIDHSEVFGDTESGASLWCLAVDPQTEVPGVGEALVRHLIEHYYTRGRNYIDLSVMHDNDEAIALYEKLAFQRVPVFCVKRKNNINEPLYTAPKIDKKLNPYATIITNEARRRGINVKVLDKRFNYFNLAFGGRSVCCRESLTELTSAVALCRCDDKRLSRRVLKSAGLSVPEQIEAGSPKENSEFLKRFKRVVVKPARGEQGDGVSVDIRTTEGLEKAVALAAKHCPDVIVEELIKGEDLRIIVIDHQFVAAAVRCPPKITGTGRHCITELIEKYNRRRMAATGGESHVPFDDETERCIGSQSYGFHDVLPEGKVIELRKTANLHTGGTIHDVTDQLHPDLIQAAVDASLAISIPVTGLDFMVPEITGPEYTIIEANERPGLANHEPQPTAERFIDFLFPQTATTT